LRRSGQSRIVGSSETLAYVGNSIRSGYAEEDGSFFIRIAGDGAATRLNCAAAESPR
jgi:hypothetical protein